MEETLLEKDLFQEKCKKYSLARDELKAMDEVIKKEQEEVIKQLKELKAKKEEIENKYIGYRTAMEVERDNLAREIMETWPGTETSYEYEFGRLTKKDRTREEVEVVDLAKLIGTLNEKKLMHKAIQTFNEEWLSNAVGMGVLTDEVKITKLNSSTLVYTPAKKEE